MVSGFSVLFLFSPCDMAVSVRTLQHGLSLFLYHRLFRVFDGHVQWEGHRRASVGTLSSRRPI